MYVARPNDLDHIFTASLEVREEHMDYFEYCEEQSIKEYKQRFGSKQFCAHGLIDVLRYSQYRDYLVNKTIVELGSGPFPQSDKYFDIFGIKDYSAIDINYSNIAPRDNVTLIKSRAIAGLKQIPTNSAIMISSDFLGFDSISPTPEGLDYIKFLIHEISRITPKGEYSFHLINYYATHQIKYFKESGFVEAEAIPNFENTLVFQKNNY